MVNLNIVDVSSVVTSLVSGTCSVMLIKMAEGEREGHGNDGYVHTVHFKPTLFLGINTYTGTT
jgi:hypothetical protein